MPSQKRLNLKNDDARSLAGELAKRTGESMTQAVIVALQERLARLDCEAYDEPVGGGRPKRMKLSEQKR
jgi:hypothetical protein